MTTQERITAIVEKMFPVITVRKSFAEKRDCPLEVLRKRGLQQLHAAKIQDEINQYGEQILLKYE